MKPPTLTDRNNPSRPVPEQIPVQLLVACVRGFETQEESNAAYNILRMSGLHSPDELATEDYRHMLDLTRQINRLLVPVSEEFLECPQLTDIATAKHLETVQAAHAVEILVNALDSTIADPKITAVPHGILQDQCLSHISGEEPRALLDQLYMTISTLRQRAESEDANSLKSAGVCLIKALYPRLFKIGSGVNFIYRLSGRKFLAVRFCEFCVLNGLLKPKDLRKAVKTLTLSVIQQFLNSFLSAQLFTNRPYQPNLEYTITRERALSA